MFVSASVIDRKCGVQSCGAVLQTTFCKLVMMCGLMAVAAGALVTAVSAQVLYGTITGIVTDPSGAVIPNATVTALETSTGVSREVQTSSEGVYLFSTLIPGTYQVTVSAQGYSRKQQNGLSVLGNTVVRANMNLTIGTVTQEVEVTTAPPELQTDTAVTEYNITQHQITELPTTSTSGRNFESLYKLVPGITPPNQSGSQASNPQGAQTFNVNGLSFAANVTRIDGAVDMNPWYPSMIAFMPPTDAIESVNMVTGSFNAEQGSAGGASVNVTIKSGTNQLHGSAWEYNTVGQYNAQAWQNRTGVKQQNIYNEVGGVIGGPIIKNKLFFFGAINRVSVVKTVTSTLSVPTMAMRGGDFTATGVTIYDPVTGTATGANKKAFSGNKIPTTRIAPAAALLLSKLPAPNTGAAGALTQNYFAMAVNHFFRYNIDSKVTYVPNQTTTYFGHYSASPSSVNDPQAFGINPGGPVLDGGSPGTGAGLIQNVGLGTTHAFTPNLLFDGNLGFTRQNLQVHGDDRSLGDFGTKDLGIPGTNNNGNPQYAGIPAMTMSTYTNYGNLTTGSPFGFFDNQYTGNLNATWTHSAHSIRVGGEYIHIQLNHAQPGSGSNSNGRGLFNFNGGITTPSGGATSPVSSFADFLLGQAYTYYHGIQPVTKSAYRSSSFSFFAQDTWQATKSLTVNYGVRYEYYPLAVSDHFGLLRFDPSVLTQVTDSFGTHNVGTVLVGGKGSVPTYANTGNGHGMFVPRLGIAYRANEKTVVRLGGGVTVDPSTLGNLLQAYPEAIAQAVSGTNSAVAATSLNAGLQSTTIQVGIPAITLPDLSTGRLPLPANISTYTIPANYRRGYIYSYNLAIQRELPASFTATITYVGTIAVRQPTTLNGNAAPPGGGTAGRLINATYGANTNNSDQSVLQPWKGSNYSGMQTQLTRRNEHVSTGIVYTYSKAMNSADNGNFAGGGSGGGAPIFGYPTYWNRNYAVAGYDRKHNFQWWTTTASPFGPGQALLRNGVAGYILGYWKLTTQLSRVSGTPFNVTASSGFLNAPGNTQLADRNYTVNPILNQNSNASRQYLNYAAFSDVTAATTGSSTPRFGTSSRNSVRGPGYFNLDVSLKRSFPIRESVKVDFVADAFDVTNTPQFANPAAGINTVTTSGGVVNLGGFGTLLTSNVNRTMRLSGRISF